MECTEIKLDLDHVSRKGLLRLVRKRWRFLLAFTWPKFGKLRVKSVDVRRTRHGYHVRLFVKNKVRDQALNFLQLALGSDYRREAFNFRRLSVLKRMKPWNVLYAWKFNSQVRITSYETSDKRMARQILRIIKSFRKRSKRICLIASSLRKGVSTQ
jgi:hypothetical protein